MIISPALSCNPHSVPLSHTLYDYDTFLFFFGVCRGREYTGRASDLWLDFDQQQQRSSSSTASQGGKGSVLSWLGSQKNT